MNWLVLLQLFSTLEPEALQLVTDIKKAIKAAPVAHQSAVMTSANALMQTMQAPGAAAPKA